MLSMTNERGEVFAKVDAVPMGETLHALVFVWADPPASVPAVELALPTFSRIVTQIREQNGQTVDTRVITEQSDVEEAIARPRADWYRSILLALGFEQGTPRVEFRMPLEQAIASLEARSTPPLMSWRSIATEPGPEIEHAAGVLRAASAGDPDAEDDALGFLLARREDDSLVLPPECLQIGLVDGRDAAIVAPSVQPKTGWCSLYYVGVLPAYRGRGLGIEAMRQGFSTMRALGGHTYHDGTGADNQPALALFRRLGASPFRQMEQWRLRL